MCGLTCVLSGWLSDNDVEVFKQLLIVSSLRGWDSTGTISIGKDKWEDPIQATVDRCSGDPYSFLMLTNWQEETKKLRTIRSLVGHCRYATKGEVTLKNAHPFKHKHIIGVHNGTIHGKFDHSDLYNTDSHALFHNIAEKGVKEGLEHIHEASNSMAFALIFYDTKAKNLHIIRNAERPLFIAYNDLKTKIFLSSEEQMLKLVLTREKIAHEDIYSLKTNTLLTIPTESTMPLKDMIIEEDYLKYKPKIISTYIPDKGGSTNKDVPFTTSTSSITTDVPWHEREIQKKVAKAIAEEAITNATRGNKTKTANVSELPKPQVVRRFYKGYRGEELTESQYLNLLAHGCAYCSAPEPSTKLAVRFISREEYLCNGCMLNPDVAQIGDAW